METGNSLVVAVETGAVETGGAVEAGAVETGGGSGDWWWQWRLVVRTGIKYLNGGEYKLPFK